VEKRKILGLSGSHSGDYEEFRLLRYNIVLEEHVYLIFRVEE
jgi:hypothetical protein